MRLTDTGISGKADDVKRLLSSFGDVNVFSGPAGEETLLKFGIVQVLPNYYGATQGEGQLFIVTPLSMAIDSVWPLGDKFRSVRYGTAHKEGGRRNRSVRALYVEAKSEDGSPPDGLYLCLGPVDGQAFEIGSLGI